MMTPETMQMVATSLSHTLGAAILEHKLGNLPMPVGLAEDMVDAVAPSFNLDTQEKVELTTRVYEEAGSFIQEVGERMVRQQRGK